MKKILIITIIVTSISKANAQQAKSVFVELGGNGYGISANFDSRFMKSQKGFGFRVGIGIFPSVNFGFGSTSTTLTIPFGINHLAGKAPNYFESGIGATFITGRFSFFGSDDVRASGIAFIPSIGYRYARLGTGFQGRIFIAPIIVDGTVELWGGVSFGYKF